MAALGNRYRDGKLNNELKLAILIGMLPRDFQRMVLQHGGLQTSDQLSYERSPSALTALSLGTTPEIAKSLRGVKGAAQGKAVEKVVSLAVQVVKKGARKGMARVSKGYASHVSKWATSLIVVPCGGKGSTM